MLTSSHLYLFWIFLGSVLLSFTCPSSEVFYYFFFFLMNAFMGDFVHTHGFTLLLCLRLPTWIQNLWVLGISTLTFKGTWNQYVPESRVGFPLKFSNRARATSEENDPVESMFFIQNSKAFPGTQNNVFLVSFSQTEYSSFWCCLVHIVDVTLACNQYLPLCTYALF